MLLSIQETDMKKDVDDTFFERADALIALANKHTEDTDRGSVSASMLYGVARFNSWAAATGFPNGEDYKKAEDDIVAYFTEQYRLMLKEHINDYAKNFDKYMGKIPATKH